MIDFICPTCGTFAFDGPTCNACDGRPDDALPIAS